MPMKQPLFDPRLDRCAVGGLRPQPLSCVGRRDLLTPESCGLAHGPLLGGVRGRSRGQLGGGGGMNGISPGAVGARTDTGETGGGEQAESSSQRQYLILAASNRSWTCEVLLPALLATASVTLIDARLVDDGRLGAAIDELQPCVVVVEQQLLEDDIGLEIRQLSALAFPARLVLLMREVEQEWADLILAGNVSGVLLEGSCGQACMSVLSKVGEGEIWLPRWVLSHALVLLRSSRADDRRAEESFLTRGRPLLTPREREIALLVADGLSNKQVASRVHLSIDTVKKNLSRIYAKFGVHDRTELAARLHRNDRST